MTDTPTKSMKTTRPETLTDRIATVIQVGHVKRQTSFAIARRVLRVVARDEARRRIKRDAQDERAEP